MAFETFLTQTQAQPTRRRRVTYLVSLVVHGVLLAVGVVYSFWHVDELSPPTVRVTFMTAAPPPPPPPPPPAAGGGATKKKVAVKTRVEPIKPNAIVQPVEKKKDDEKKKPDDDDDDDRPPGVAGGKKGGVIGGTIGGTVGGTIGGTIGGTQGGVIGGEPGPVVPKILPPNMGALQKLPGMPDPPFPPVLRKAGMVYVVSAKICIGKTGAVDSVTLVKKADALLDDNVINTVKGWRYRPLMANNTPVPFCYIGRFEFKPD